MPDPTPDELYERLRNMPEPFYPLDLTRGDYLCMAVMLAAPILAGYLFYRVLF